MRDEMIRRIDDLGRIVIPKDIRNLLQWCPGDQIKIFVNAENVILSRYHVLDSLDHHEVVRIARTIGNEFHLPVIISNENRVIAVSGLNNAIISKPVYCDVVCRKDPYDSLKSDLDLTPIESVNLVARYIQPIHYNHEVVGAIILIQPDKFIAECEEFSAETLASRLHSYSVYIQNYLGGSIQ